MLTSRCSFGRCPGHPSGPKSSCVIRCCATAAAVPWPCSIWRRSRQVRSLGVIGSRDQEGAGMTGPFAFTEPGGSSLARLDHLLDRDLLRPGLAVDLGRSRQADLQHTVGVFGLDLALLDALRHRHVALKVTEAALLPVVALFLDLLVGFPLARHYQFTLLELDVDVLRLHAGQVQGDDRVAVSRED